MMFKKISEFGQISLKSLPYLTDLGVRFRRSKTSLSLAVWCFGVYIFDVFAVVCFPPILRFFFPLEGCASRLRQFVKTVTRSAEAYLWHYHENMRI